MPSVLNVQLGVCDVTFKGVNLGHTIGGVTVKYTPEYKETKVDKFAGVAEKFLIGQRLVAELSLAEYILSNLQIAVSESTLAGDDSITIGSNAGKRASRLAGLLLLHPISETGRDADVSIYKAVVTNELVIEHKNDTEKVLPVIFEGLIDENRTDGNMLGFIGDSIS